jgi:hypothetical protein
LLVLFAVGSALMLAVFCLALLLLGFSDFGLCWRTARDLKKTSADRRSSKN